MGAEIREFNVTTLPFVVRFGLGSTEAVKRWARFEIRENEELLWTNAGDVRRDIDKTNRHISVYKSGKIVSSIYQGKGQEQKKIHSYIVGDIGGSLRQIKKPHQVTSGIELLEPGFPYYGLDTFTDKQIRQATGEILIPCLDNRLVNSKLHDSLDLVPWVGSEQVIAYVSSQGRPFDMNDSRSHMSTFRCGQATIVITMRFTEGDGPLDIQQVTEADKNKHPLKRLIHVERLTLSESTRLAINASSPFWQKMIPSKLG